MPRLDKSGRCADDFRMTGKQLFILPVAIAAAAAVWLVWRDHDQKAEAEAAHLERIRSLARTVEQAAAEDRLTPAQREELDRRENSRLLEENNRLLREQLGKSARPK
jgi:hypothetical protein